MQLANLSLPMSACDYKTGSFWPLFSISVCASCLVIPFHAFSCPQESASTYALKCNIDATVNHLHDGIVLGLKDDREKHSEVRVNCHFLCPVPSRLEASCVNPVLFSINVFLPELRISIIIS